ncbi:MAG: hypothetical protein H0Z30_08955, partial [Candidatus Marinimicrobia bacterium]|nr:hypothetical protein [Candidatus Neomarinimicrobiota bacterium]
MSGFKYPRGSEWRKWDLHFHTPSSYDYQDKTVSNERIIEVLRKNNISVVAITDHHIVDVDRIAKLRELAGDEITILPGIELCSDTRGDEPIHFIGIFPENINLEFIKNELLAKTNINRQRQNGRRENEIYCDLKDTSKLIKEIGGIVTIHAGRKSNSIENITNSLPTGMAEKRDIAEYIDIFELGKSEDQEDYKNIVFKKIGSYPMIICSDNHDINNYSLKSICWIKADPTFEGLKQIIYEPDERVRIQEGKPEEKRSYFVISKVRFIDNTGQNNFQSDYIELNQDLTSIIGGKSTGKSLLLYYIAKTINQDEVSNRLKDIESNIDIYDFHDNKNFDFEVVWQDGTSQLLKDKKSVSEKNIVYIPQGYLINITEPHKEKAKLFESKQAINKFILDVLKQDEEIKKRLETQETEKNKLLKNISSDIDFIMDAKDEINRLKEEISSIGDKEGVKKEIDKLKNDIGSLQKKSELTSEELEKYNELSEKKRKVNEQISNIQSDVEIISELKDYLSGEKENLLDAIINRYFNLLSTEDIKKKVGEIKDSIENFFTDISDEVEKLINYQKQKELKKLQEEISDIDKNLVTYISKLKAEKVLQHKDKLYQEEISKLNKILELEKKIKNNIDAIENKKVSIIENSQKIYNGYKQLANYFKEKEKILGEELLLNLKVGFKEQEFTAVLRDMFIIPDIKKKFGELFDYKEELSYQFENSEKHVEFIEKMVGYVLNNEIKIAKYKYVEETLIKLLGDYFYLDFSITYKGDALEKMSPGKRNLVILKIIIGLSKDKWPILIDQPEDNLDNRSVYEDLVEFVKNSKKNRQIILITHNPNLVVGTDSEEVIVCNQEGQGEDTQKKCIGSNTSQEH